MEFTATMCSIDVVYHSVTQYNDVERCAVQHNAVQRNVAVGFRHAMQHSLVLLNVTQYNDMQRCTVRRNAVQ